MNFLRLSAALMVLSVSLAGGGAGCSSKKDKVKVKHSGHDTAWDHEKIRANREQEQAQSPADFEKDKKLLEADSKCVYVSGIQLKRSQNSGCRPVDPRAGMGSDMFCCPANGDDE